MLRLLLDHGADENACTNEIVTPIRKKHLGIAGITALMCAAENGNESAVRLLLDRGAYVNASTNPDIHSWHHWNLAGVTALM